MGEALLRAGVCSQLSKHPRGGLFKPSVFHVLQTAFRSPDGSGLDFLKDSTYLQAGRSNPSGLKDVNPLILLYMFDYFKLTTTCLSLEPGELKDCNTRAFFPARHFH